MANQGVWVDGEYLNFYDANGVQHQGQGALINSPVGAIRGSWWIDTSDHAYHFISQAGNHYTLPTTLVGAVPGAIPGSSFISSSYIYYVTDQQNLAYWYQDTSTHDDASTAYSDVPYSDVAPSHSDSHSDVAASHSDIAHSDVYSDVTVAHTDNWHANSYSDVAHTDYNDAAYNPPYLDAAHSDIHNDSTATGAGTYYDSPGSHADSYSDVAYSDITNPYSDSYSDVSTVHSDVAHIDIPATHTDQILHTDTYG